MVDQLKKSLEELEPPVCERCDRAMKWFRSEIQRAAPSLVDHQFFCETCGGTAARVTTIRSRRANGDGPAQLSLPASFVANMTMDPAPFCVSHTR